MSDMSLYLAIALIPLAGSLLAGLFGNQIGRAGAHTVTILGVAISAVLSGFVLWGFIDGSRAKFDENVYTWLTMGGIDFSVGFLVDSLTAMMMVVVTSVSLMVHIYTIGYMHDDKVGYQRFFSYISLFTFSMLMLVMSNNFIQLFFGWEAVGLVSYLLIGFYFKRESAIFANLKAFLVNRVGDFGFILGIGLILAYFGGSLRYADVFAYLPNVQNATISLFPGVEWSLMTVTCLLLFVGAMGKSAQFPLHVWLPDSMEGPTPISALIHAATMVTAGVYLMVRSGAIYAVSESAALAVAIIGAITLLFGAIVGSAKDDMKKVLAASTMSQIGYMMLAAGLGPVGAGFAIFHLVTHGFFKANMFLGAGSVMHAMGDQVNMRGFGGLRKYMPITWATFLCGYLAIIGFPFLSGFYSKDKIIETAFVGEGWQPWVFGTLTMLVAGLTAFYMSRMFFMIFHGEERFSHEGPNAQHPHEASAAMYVPQILLAVGSLILGFLLNQFSFVEWLAPAIGHGEHGEPVLPVAVITGLTLALVAVGVGIAWKMYLATPVPQVAPTGNFLTEAARQDLYQDTVNERIFMDGGLALTTGVAVVDEYVVDGAVEGTAKATTGLGKVLAHLQNGYVRTYASYMLVGVVIALLIALATRI